MKKFYYFTIKENGRSLIVNWGNSANYTPEQAEEGIKKYCRENNCEFLRVTTEEDERRADFFGYIK